jgi:hypothetical protein
MKGGTTMEEVLVEHKDVHPIDQIELVATEVYVRSNHNNSQLNIQHPLYFNQQCLVQQLQGPHPHMKVIMVIW